MPENRLNFWTKRSIEFANQQNYLDCLFRIYPINLNLQRTVNPEVITEIETLYEKKNNRALLELLLKQDLFPKKDSYVAYLKRDPASLDRNPLTCARLAGQLYELGPKEIIAKITAPKEANRQMGPLFNRWITTGVLGCAITSNPAEILNTHDNIILSASDDKMKDFAQRNFGFSRDKCLDFIAKFNNKYIFGEAKFLTDFGGHQNAQFMDAISTLISPLQSHTNVMTIAILDGVLYIKGKNKMYKELCTYARKYPILSALLLRDFLYAL